MTSLRSFAAALCAATLVCASARAETAKPRFEPPPNYLRPAVEIAVGLGAATLWYVVDERNVLDWDSPSLEARLNGQAWRFDSNGFALNYVWHPLAGAGMYVLARGNRLSPLPASVYSLAGSTAWEYAIEFNEKVSINDMLITPMAGLAIGEFFHKLSLLASAPAPRSAARTALAWTVGLSVHGHNRLDQIEPARAPELWRQLELSYGFGLTRRGGEMPRGAHRLGFEGRLVSLPGYLAREDLGRGFADADFASFDLALDLSHAGVGADAFAETWLAGYHYQRGGAPLRRSVGMAATGALALAYTYRSSRAFGFDDRQGLLHFPGLVLELRGTRGQLEGLLRGRGYPSFGSMSAAGYPSFRSQYPGGRGKTVLERESYFYGYGFTAGFEGRVRFAALELRAELGVSRLHSIEGLDRAQERVTRDLPIQEAELGYALSAGVKPRQGQPEFALVLERRRRDSWTSGHAAHASGERLTFELTLPL